MVSWRQSSESTLITMSKKISLEDLENGLCGSGSFKGGEQVRIYLNYHGGEFGRIHIREGVVLNPHAEKIFLGIPHTSCLQLKVKKAGQVIDGRSELERTVIYTQKYLYYNIGRVEKL